MSDLIRVVDLEVWSRIGVPSEERLEPQRLLVTLEMGVESFCEAAAHDDILRTVDYFDVSEYVKSFANEESRWLLETFAEELARELLSRFAIRRLRVEVKKFVLPNAAYVSVIIERGNPSRAL